MRVFKFGGKVTGTLDGNVFKKNVDPIVHFMRKNQSWGIDLETFKDLPEECQIILHDTMNNWDYKSDVAAYKKNGTVENYGHARQIFLKKELFNRTQ